MENVREFKLINEKGQEFSMMDLENYCLLTDPEGLGYSYTTTYEQVGNTFIENLRKLEQGQIIGTANFGKYENYKKLVNFIEQSESLKFAYKVPLDSQIKQYYKDVNIQSVPKSQKQTNGIISETLTFDCLGLWYEQTTATYDMSATDNEIRWDFSWDSMFIDYDTRRLSYVNAGHVEAPIEVEISGAVVNPSIELYVENELYLKTSVNITLTEYEKLLYGSKENKFYLLKENEDGTQETLFKREYIDFESFEVIRIPKNKSCEIRLVADNDILNATVTIYCYYKAV